MMTYCRDRLHGRCILENLSIRSPISGSTRTRGARTTDGCTAP